MMADLIQYIKEEASRNLRLAEKTKGSRQRTHSIRAKHLQRAVAEIERLTAERDSAEANLERLQNKFEQVTGENVRLTSVVRRLKSGLRSVQVLIDSTEGVTGLHLNGDIAPWDELLAGGQFEGWLRDFSTATNSGSPKPKRDHGTDCDCSACCPN